MISRHPVVAAIDFGTHGTGYAWTEVGDDAGESDPSRLRLQVSERWPGSPTPYPKDLTAVLLDGDGEVAGWGHEALGEWANLSRAGDLRGHVYVHGFKMALKPGEMPGLGQLDTGVADLDTPAKVYPLVVAYLRRIYRVVLEEIEGSGYLEGQIRWCVTIPAIWDDAEKQLMRDAAIEAGMPADYDRLLLAREPEVAALHCQVHLARVVAARDEKRTERLAGQGERFMVVDCGGGTIDITAYRLAAGTGPDRHRLVEIGKVSGGRLGSEYINQAFVDRILTDRLGGAENVRRIRRECPHALLELLQAWESGKISVTAVRDRSGLTIERPVYVSLPRDIDPFLDDDVRKGLASRPGGSASRIVVTPEEIRDLFDGVLKSLIELLEQQLRVMRANDGKRSGPERLLLVGGLSGSSYLRQRLLDHFGDAVVLMRATDPASAVLRGAVLLGYDPSLIKSRRSRYTYGCATALTFEPGRDPDTKRLESEEDGDLCDDRFRIFVRSGDEVETGSLSEEHTFFPITSSQGAIGFTFFRSTETGPRYVDEPGCEAIGTLKVALRSAMSLPRGNRAVRMRFGFGDTEIGVRAVNVHTGEELDTTLRFDGD